MRELFHGAGVANMTITTLRARIEAMERQKRLRGEPSTVRVATVVVATRTTRTISLGGPHETRTM
jgi:hypothetical protein